VAVPFVHSLFGFDANGKPTPADSSSSQSMAISHELLRQLGCGGQAVGGQSAGSALEHGVRDLLATQLPLMAPASSWDVRAGRPISHYWQYEHLARVHAIFVGNPLLKAELGVDYLVKPDVVVSVPGRSTGGLPSLHAVVSCKFTLRSDRAQNIRHEAITLVRHRRGRQPHIVAVTGEPLPSRLAALCRGTGEIDAVYHTCLNELVAAVAAVGNSSQRSDLDEFVAQRRLFDLSDLAGHLSV
jgi:hypothetical protein